MVLAAKEERVVTLPTGVRGQLEGTKVTITGPKGTLVKEFKPGHYTIAMHGEKITVACNYPRRKDRAMVGTVEGIINSMAEGVTKGFEYKLQVNYSHFPMNVSVAGDKVIIKNFLGEKFPRESKIAKGVKVEVKAMEITVTGSDCEKVGQTAKNIVLATKVGRRDPRIFGDGIFITSKGD